MTRVTVTVPATCLNLGPGIDCLGLALSLHNTVEMSLYPNTGLPKDFGAGDTGFEPAGECALSPFLTFARRTILG